MHWIDSIDDPRVAPYRNLRDRTLRGESIFVTEGELVTKRLLASDWDAHSVFASEQYAEEFQGLVKDVPLYVSSEKTLIEVAGFKFHRGVLGAGRRRPTMTLDELMARTDASGPLLTPAKLMREGDQREPGLFRPPAGRPRSLTTQTPISLVICPEVTSPDNLGLIFRSAAGFGIEGVILGGRCCDPFSRRSLRVSMGSVLQTPLVRSADLETDLRRLKGRWAVELVATVLDDRAERLGELRWPDRTGLLLGNEFGGLRGQWLSLCDRQVTIPMAPGTDSLNLGVAAGVFVYEMTKRLR
jgi:tRNA G18 (ribose-2'-O)-methylase SpoU